MAQTMNIALRVNGQEVRRAVNPRQHLADFLREELHLTGTHIGCEHGICGACTVLIDGDSMRSCLTLAVQCDGASIETVESLGTPEVLSPIQARFQEYHALQCGFCTPGMLMTTCDILRKRLAHDRESVAEALSGNLCRCTGYRNIVDAVLSLVQEQGQAET